MINIEIINHKFLKKSLKAYDELLIVCISVHFCTKTCKKVYKNVQETVKNRAEKFTEQ